MDEWVECKISDIGTVVGGATPSTKKPENYEDGKIAWITPRICRLFQDDILSEAKEISQKLD